MNARVIAAVNHKGGVGKTTLTVNLGACLAQDFRVLVVDLDPQRSASFHLGLSREDIARNHLDSAFGLFAGGGGVLQVTELSPSSRIGRPTLNLIPGSERLMDLDIILSQENASTRTRLLQRNLYPYRAAYDFILLDCPPSLNLVTVNALMAADAYMVPVYPEYLALEGLLDIWALIQKVQATAGQVGKPAELGIIFTRTDERVKATGEIIGALRDAYKERVFTTQIGYSVKLQEAPSHGQSIMQYAPRSPARVTFDKLVKEFLFRISAAPALRNSVLQEVGT